MGCPWKASEKPKGRNRYSQDKVHSGHTRAGPVAAARAGPKVPREREPGEKVSSPEPSGEGVTICEEPRGVCVGARPLV